MPMAMAALERAAPSVVAAELVAVARPVVLGMPAAISAVEAAVEEGVTVPLALDRTVVLVAPAPLALL
ncbi:hypothetical protein [Pseudomonas abietaniphila]